MDKMMTVRYRVIHFEDVPIAEQGVRDLGAEV